MKFFRRSEIKAFKAGDGEEILQYASRLEKNGSSKSHSMAIMTLAPNASSQKHHHLIAEESFLITKGRGIFIIEGEERECFVGDCVLVKAGESHILKNTGGETLEVVICTSPPWTPEDSHQK